MITYVMNYVIRNLGQDGLISSCKLSKINMNQGHCKHLFLETSKYDLILMDVG